MDPMVQGLHQVTLRLLEVKLENARDKTWVMEEGIRADESGLRALETEHLVLVRTKERLRAVLDVGRRQGRHEAARLLSEVKLENERDKTWVMEEGLRASEAAERAKEIENLVVMREEERLQAVLEVAERLADVLVQLEAGGNMNSIRKNAMMGAIKAWVISFESFSHIHGNN